MKMALTINITTETIEDYDGNEENIKAVTVEIDGEQIKESYSYANNIDDTTIESEVQDDLTAKGYSW